MSSSVPTPPLSSLADNLSLEIGASMINTSFHKTTGLTDSEYMVNQSSECDTRQTHRTTTKDILNDQLKNLTGALESNDSSIKLTDEEKSYFITFEEWKKQKVARKSQELQLKHIEEEEEEKESRQQRIRSSEVGSGSLNNLDGPVGEEMEFDSSLFTGDEAAPLEEGMAYKGRFNYASFDCAATIVRTNEESKGSNAVLNENKDTYLLNQCKAPHKFLDIELCEDILVDEVMIGNFEFFSSVFRDIRISVGDRYPTTDWKVIGEYEAENLRKLQRFKIEDPMIWARFLRIEILSYYGSEFYCPISTIQVYGKTMMEQFKEENHETSFSVQTEKEDPLDASIEFNVDLNNDSEVLDLKDIENDDVSCVIVPHVGLEQFLEGHKQEEQDLCTMNTTVVFGESNTNISTQYISLETTSSSSSQESIYRNIIKRLSLLESNATLSLLYIEEQSKILSEAFENLENRQKSRFDKLIGQLNTTIHFQVTHFRKLNTDMAVNFEGLLNYQNHRFESFMSSYKQRMDSFQSSLSFQKRMNFFNFVVIIFLLTYILSLKDNLDVDYYHGIDIGAQHVTSKNIQRSSSDTTVDSIFSSSVSVPDVLESKIKDKITVSGSSNDDKGDKELLKAIDGKGSPDLVISDIEVDTKSMKQSSPVVEKKNDTASKVLREIAPSSSR
ncbi:hypothetical protein FOA43_000336 [Brettanomyces nanus]|uniref:SUN-like protein 1 n=1 Tax=Eeniella nana TaxID=13502 RepID=A0A875RYP1_EENNA|nr:uncharacterized protein FOA43_000336 [Brettanomyces nanus]QPG73032.1 hypothetical protein FOA43_000336 [Brettanomyces nanus]